MVSDEAWKLTTPQLRQLIHFKLTKYQNQIISIWSYSCLLITINNQRSGLNIFSCMITKLEKWHIEEVCIVIRDFQMERILFKVVKQAEDFILSHFIAFYISHSTQLDRFEGPHNSIMAVLNCLSEQAYIIFVHIIKYILEFYKSWILLEYLHIDMQWASPLFDAIANSISQSSSCLQSVTIAHIIISIYNVVGIVGPTWFQLMLRMLFDLNLSFSICLKSHDKQWQKIAEFKKCDFTLLWRWIIPLQMLKDGKQVVWR